MKNLIRVLIVLSMLFSSWAFANTPDSDAYQHCLDNHVAPTEQRRAAKEVKSACSALYDSYSVLSDDDENYYQCILNRMPHARNPTATREIKRECDKKFRSLFE